MNAAGQGSEPEWNETFTFTVSDDVDELRLKIMDKEKRSQHGEYGDSESYGSERKGSHKGEERYVGGGGGYGGSGGGYGGGGGGYGDSGDGYGGGGGGSG
ncbi:C2 domain-containing protein [Pyrus ussuriensis x Pyrus communis]|uniref:C2 domain-containing protein n=1 Tax=Pyrus ussuriensis x Pyrus communis TaxID=2448454 RepID=A0A5N5EYJ5_9ROSA|nr:C2 domain-containing protein [Pyrus ussuriensis x Pyrus communis]